MRPLRFIGAMLAGCVGLTGHAQVGPLVGTAVPTQETVKVTSSSDAGFSEMEIEFERPTMGAPFSINAAWLRVGASSGTFTLAIEREFVGTLATVQVTFLPNQWNRIALPDVQIAPGELHFVRVTPNSGADAEFIHIQRATPYQLGQTGAYPSYEVLVRRVKTGGAGLFWGGSLVFEIAGVPENRPELGCLASLPAVTGTPYIGGGTALMPPGTSRSQRIVLGPRPSTLGFDGIPYVEAQLTSDAGLAWELSAPGREARSGTVPGGNFQAIVPTAGFIPAFVGDAGVVEFTLTFRAGNSEAWWPYVSTGPGSLTACDPIARATFGGAPVGGLGAADEHGDLRFSTERYATTITYRDRDFDNFGDPAVPVLAVLSFVPAGYSATATDCDDTDANTRPGAPEVCDGKDNDCDGIAEGADSDLVIAACERVDGVCKGAVHSRTECLGGTWRACESADYAPSFEKVETTCDGLDNDCDGRTDVVAKAGLCGPQLGVCLGARATLCSTAPADACAPADYGPFYEETERSCDGLDNDCDGTTDGDDPDIRAPACALQRGVCGGAIQPVAHCSSAGWQPCDAREYGANYQPEETRCDGLDNDCDGLIDEGCSVSSTTTCGCTAGGPGLCLLLVWAAARNRRKRLIS